MDKQAFFKAFAPKVKSYEMPNGDCIDLHELSAGQRGKFTEAFKKSSVDAQALVICMSCSLFDEADVDEVKGLPGELVTDLADAVLVHSGLADEDAEKN